MKTKYILPLLALALTARAYDITNVNVGIDSNSNAWTKVNLNNNNFTAWNNALDATNANQETRIAANTTQLNFINPSNGLLTANYLLLAPVTIATSSSSTYGRGAGLITGDTNYIYISVGTNAWRRISVGTGVW
jgi:hypothetical protein